MINSQIDHRIFLTQGSSVVLFELTVSGRNQCIWGMSVQCRRTSIHHNFFSLRSSSSQTLHLPAHLPPPILYVALFQPSSANKLCMPSPTQSAALLHYLL